MKMINLKGDLFATVFCFAVSGMARLASSLILTRILYPEAFGTVSVLTSIVYSIEMISDIGVIAFVTRDKNGDNANYLNTIWTVRLVRSWINLSILFIGAPLIASVYAIPALTDWLQIYCLWFVFHGLESMSFALAVRHKRARIVSYSDLVCALISIAFVIVFSHYSRDESGMVYGMLLERLLRTLSSYLFYRDARPRIQFDHVAARDLFGFTKYVMPSSWISLVLSQFDKIIFLKLFDLKLLGLYGLANAIAGPIDSLVTQANRNVLYARCATNWRDDRSSYRAKYYRENLKLLMVTLFLPAAVGGAANAIIGVLYDPRYAFAAVILQAFGLRGMLMALSGPAENMLSAADDGARVVLMGNLFRVAWVIPAAFFGYHLLGFEGFLYGVALKELPPVIYFFWLQHKNDFLVVRYEASKIAFMATVFLVSSWLGGYFLGLRPILVNLWSLVRP